MRSLLSVFLLATAVVAQAPVAHVNDPASPGVLGDALLSFDEAIRIVNGALPLGSLSTGELAQLTGVGTPTAIEIDATVTPTLTLAQTLTPLDGPAVGVDIAIRGVNGVPSIDATGLAVGLPIRTNMIDITGLRFVNGADAITADASVHMMMNRQMRFDGLAFTGQTGAGMRFSAMGMMAMTMALIAHTDFGGLATGIAIEDRSMGGAVMLDVEHCTFDAVSLAIAMFTDATGAMTMCRVWRSAMTSGTQFANVRRGATSDQRSMLMVVASEIHTSGDAFDALGTPLVETAVHVHHSVIRPDAGRNAFVVGPNDARIDFHISENIVYGDIDVEEGRLNRRLWAWNNLFRDGVFTVANLGSPQSFRWNRFERCTFRALPSNAAQCLHTTSEFESCTIDGQSLTGDILLENTYTHGCTLVGNVAETLPAPAPWIAQASASTTTPAIGTSLDLILDLPVGMWGIWQIGISNSRLVLTQEPWRFYAFQNNLILVPGIYAYHSSVTIPVPNDPHLIGAELYCEPLTAPFLGQTYVPPINLPRGVHLSITR